jgi:hypothetical protein
VEHIVNASTLRQLQMICHLADALQHLVGPGVLGAKLATAARSEGLSGTVEQSKPHPVPNGELQGAVFVVIVPARILLRLKKTGAHLLQELITIGQECVDGVRLCLAWCIG